MKDDAVGEKGKSGPKAVKVAVKEPTAKKSVVSKVVDKKETKGGKKLSGDLANNQNKLGALLAARKGPPPAFARGNSDNDIGGKTTAAKKPVKAPAAKRSVQFSEPDKEETKGGKKLSGDLVNNQNKLGALLAARKGPPPAFARGNSDNNSVNFGGSVTKKLTGPPPEKDVPQVPES